MTLAYWTGQLTRWLDPGSEQDKMRRLVDVRQNRPGVVHPRCKVVNPQQMRPDIDLISPLFHSIVTDLAENAMPA